MIELDVVIPVRNVDRYLPEALASVWTQQADVAVVIVDAGSDRPVAIPEAAADDPRVRLLRSEEPLTAGAARNLGAAAGTAEWISFLDADDVWTPGSRRLLIDAAESSGAGLSHGTVDGFHADEAARALAMPEPGRPALLAGGVTFRRSTWEAVGPFDARLRAGEFVDWYTRLAAAGVGVIAIPDVVLMRRIHLASTTAVQARTQDRDDYLEVVRRWMNRNDS